MPKKPEPVVRVDSPWGTEIDPEGLQQGRDAFYVEGYSDKREQYDAAVREGERPTPLANRLQYVSVQRSSGAPDKAKESWYRARGYVPVTRENCASFGIDAQKSGFIWDADGTARVGSQMLMGCPAAKVAGHAKDLKERNEALARSGFNRMEEAVDDFNRRHPELKGTSFDLDERNDDKPFEFERKLFKGK
jgi:hypothetical protein